MALAKKTKKKVVEIVYSFKNNKDVIDYVQMWETKLELVEKERSKIEKKTKLSAKKLFGN